MSASAYTLVIGTKNWSSWSLRPWFLMRATGIAFTEIEIPLRQPDTAERIARHSPSGKVPLLKLADGYAVWDSLAIAELLAERHPEHALWPAAPRARAEARAVSAEMHSGFQALRNEMPMDCLAHTPVAEPSEAVQRDIARIRSIWSGARAAYGADGPFLFGRLSIADAMYAPVVSRFRTYGVALATEEQRYAETIWATPAMTRWLTDCAIWAATTEAGP
jgi:glutathione S-transferase